ncbi:MAG: rhodanese-like domain-containing protein [Gammaproteobacteria bacterium]|nr:rhodanese-like domain-containing protein [Gammaproteobacteria bacterium]
MKLATHCLLFVVFVAFSLGINAEDKISPQDVPGARTITAAEAKKLFDREVEFVDVRNDKDWDAGRIPGAIHLDLKKSFTEEELAKIVGKDTEVVIYCNGPKCLRSSEASALAVKWGYKKIFYFRGGIPDWKAASYPIE